MSDVPKNNYRSTQQTLVQTKMSDSEINAELELLKTKLKLPILNREKNIGQVLDHIEVMRQLDLGDWKKNFINLCYNSNESPYRCAEAVGIAWSWVVKIRKEDKANGDRILADAIEHSKIAYAEAIMMHPEQYAGNSSMAIFMAKALAGWSEASVNEFGTPNDVELERILEARKDLRSEIQNLDKEYHLGNIRESGNSNDSEQLKLTA